MFLKKDMKMANKHMEHAKPPQSSGKSKRSCSECHFPRVRTALVKVTDNTQCGEDLERVEPSHHQGEGKIVHNVLKQPGSSLKS